MNYNPSSVMPNSITGMLPTPAVGYRFHPTNEELITNYLKPKVFGDDVEDLVIIAEVNVCKHEPWDLPVKSNIKSDDSVWYFFCRRDFKYLNSRRSNRRTERGFWKPTGKNVKIKASRTKKQIGTKKTLVFYKKATPKPLRTDWIIHEYECTFDSNQSNQGEYVLCKLKKKSDEKLNKGEPNHHVPSVSDFEAEPSCSMTSVECQNRSEMTVNSSCNESEVSQHVACDIGYQYSNELMPNSSSQLMSDSAIDLIVSSPCENGLTASDLEDLVSPPQLNSVCSPFVEMPPNSIYQSTYDKSETSCLAADDFEYQNHDKESNISASNEGACNPLMAAPSDLENPNPWEKTDILTLEDFFLSFSPDPFSENIVGNSPLTEVSPQELAELEAFLELENSLKSPLQPSDMGFGTSASS